MGRQAGERISAGLGQQSELGSWESPREVRVALGDDVDHGGCDSHPMQRVPGSTRATAVALIEGVRNFSDPVDEPHAVEVGEIEVWVAACAFLKVDERGR